MGEGISFCVPDGFFAIIVTFLSEPFRKPVDCDAVAVIADDQAEAVVSFSRASALGAIGEVDAFFA